MHRKNIKKTLIFKILKKFYHLYLYTINYINRKKAPFDIKGLDETLNVIISEHKSVARFGEGEFKWCYNIDNPSFQDYSEKMAERLRQVVASNDSRIMICLCDCFGDLKFYNREARDFWEVFAAKYRYKFYALLNFKTIYYNAMITRCYIDYKDKSKSKERIMKLMEIWKNRNVIVVEGNKTRLGVNNDFLNGANSVRRILAPAINAFDKYDIIYEKVKQHIAECDIFLIALGPTATILAYDIATKLNVQAVDIGHADIEYEWLLLGATNKVPILNKFVNECGYNGGNDEFLDDITYQKQIIERVY